MSIHANAGKLSDIKDLISIPALVAAYYTDFPDPSRLEQQISFGTSGHRGTSEKTSFNEEHIYAVTQAVCDVRKKQGITGPLFLGVDTHALSEPAYRSALEVLVANGVNVCISEGSAFTPTPVISHAILCWNRQNSALADGIIITPSHNPPCDGGFKYNPPHGGPAESSITSQIEARANDLLQSDNKDVQLVQFRKAITSKLVHKHDYISNYVNDLANVIDMDIIASSGIKLGVDPLGGASIDFWEPIAERYKLDLTVVSKECDPTFRFVPLDRDGKIRMDCSSAYSMSKLIKLKDSFDLAFACDPDADRHGIVTRAELMNPNHYLAVVTHYLFKNRPSWSEKCGVGKTLVTSFMIDKVAQSLGKKVIEVPVGFKWFVPYLNDGTCAFGCEESAGASFLRKDGSVWSTDKDGILLCLLAAEITAKEKKSPSEIYKDLTEKFGTPLYERISIPATAPIKDALLNLDMGKVKLLNLAGSSITDITTKARANNANIGGLKVSSNDGWFAIRPSGTEDICKIYAESFKDDKHLKCILEEASTFLKSIVKEA